jgi:hypothetical protein
MYIVNKTNLRITNGSVHFTILQPTLYKIK